MTTKTEKPENNENTKKKPDYRVHVVLPNGRNTRIGPAVGVAFKHNASDGINVYLDAVPAPIDGRWQFTLFTPE